MINYHATGFGPHMGAPLRGTHSLQTEWCDLVWAAITVGKPGVAHLFSHGWHSVSDIISRAFFVYSNLQQAGTKFSRSSLYNQQDPSEKGMLAAKIVAARLLDTPWLMHVSMFTAGGGVVRKLGNNEPDLIGYTTSGDWIVAEAKGRSGGFSKDAMTKAKFQTRCLRMINGQFPALRVAVQAHFSPTLQIDIEDPVEFEDDSRDITGSTGLALQRYYSGALAATQQSPETRQVRGRTFESRRFEEVGVTIGIDRTVKKSIVDDGEPPALDDDQLKSFVEASEYSVEERSTIFKDGILVELDERWSEQNMRRNPMSRNRFQ